MLKSSRKASSTVRFSPDKTSMGSELFTDQAGLIRPEDRFFDEALENLHYRSLITLALGKNFRERTKINRNEVERFTLLYGTDPKNVRISTYSGIAPLKRRGFSWESTQSRTLRKKYRSSADRMFDRMDLCDFGPDHFNSGTIELVNIPFKTVDYLEFSSAAGLVDKRPHKRRNHNSGDAIYFKDFYLDGKRGMLFGVFDALTDGTNSDHKVASLLVSLFKRFFNSVSFTQDRSYIFTLFSSFLNQAERSISGSTSLSGASISIGIVFEGELYYLNIGDSRIYTISFYPEVNVNKITIDDGMAGLVERGASIPKKEFFSQLKSPEHYVGGFSQLVGGRKRAGRVLHREIRPVSPNMGKVSLSGRDFVLIATDGFWSNLPIYTEKGNISDASGESPIREVLKGRSPRDPKQILEALYDYSKLNMKLKRTTTYKNSVVKPFPQDMALLGFSV